MPTNVSHEFIDAEKKYARAQTLDEKIKALREMISAAPAHKGGENLRAELRTRMKKFLEKKEKNKKTGKSTKKTIRKEGTQVSLIGLTNSGKSSILSKITNAKPKATSAPFETKEPIIGTMHYDGIKAQIVDIPSIGSEAFDVGIVNTSDIICIVLERSLEDLEKIKPYLEKSYGKVIIIVNKVESFNENQLRKLNATIKSKKLNAIPVSAQTNFNIEKLKEKIFEEMNVIRVFTKEPGQQPSKDPMTLKKDSTVKEAAESIYKGFSAKVKEAKVTGPSSKFPNQRVGLGHKLKDKDIIEFKEK